MAERKLAIVPAYNEQGSVAQVVREIHDRAPDFDVVVVDDGSTDLTRESAEAAGAVVLRHPFNLGIGGAVQSGYLYALENDYDMAVQVDGDGQHDPAQLKLLVDAMHADPHVDFVYGSRFKPPRSYDGPLNRRIGIAIFAGLLSVVTRQKVTDPTSGFRLGNRRVIELFARDYPHDYPEVEAILMMHAHQIKSAEVAVVMRERETGSSSITWVKSGYYMVKVMLAVLVGLCRARPNIRPGDDAPVSSGSGL